MRFGLFGSAQAKRGGGPNVDSGSGFRDFVDYNMEAEQLGYHSTFIVEHHFTGYGQISATLNLLTWIGAKTSTLRLGTAVMVLPWHNPILLAEQAATIDLLSQGRLDLGIGKGYRFNEFKGFGIPMEEADSRFEECVKVLLKSWTSDTAFTHKGKHWTFEDVIVEPPSYQKPHPMLWMGAGSPASIKRVAERGMGLLLDQFAPHSTIIERVALFKAECEKAGRKFDPMSVGAARAVYICDTPEEKEKILAARIASKQNQNKLAQRPDGQNKASIMAYDDTKETAEAGALYGTVDEIISKLQYLKSGGVEYVLLNIGAAGPNGRTITRRFAKEIMPALA
jgi:alkanesulfonate monooxygenase SsuD/methylene tetrahydromethanopterin reductase-like flavin-dependent oxidoreductase (luciferase family)